MISEMFAWPAFLRNCKNIIARMDLTFCKKTGEQMKPGRFIFTDGKKKETEQERPAMKMNDMYAFVSKLRIVTEIWSRSLTTPDEEFCITQNDVHSNSSHMLPPASHPIGILKKYCIGRLIM